MKYLIESNLVFRSGERTHKITQSEFEGFMYSHQAEDFNDRDIQEIKKVVSYFDVKHNQLRCNCGGRFYAFKFEDEWFLVLHNYSSHASSDWQHYYKCDGLESVLAMLVVLKK